MTIIIVIVCVLVLLFCFFFLFKCLTASNFIKRVANEENTIVYGTKGKGKTLLFSIMSRSCRYGWASNTDFKHNKGVIITPSDVSCAPNTWENVLNGDIKPIDKKWILESKSIFLDDAGVFMPNFAEYMLKIKYPSLPISFALWRHFYNAPIHLNSQDLGRSWKLLREQQCSFIRVKSSFRFLFFGFVKVVYYDRIAGATAEVDPYKAGFGNKYAKAEKESFHATYGEVKSYTVPFITFHHRYDSRYFHKEFFGEKAPSKKVNKRFQKDNVLLQRSLARLEKKPSWYCAPYNNQ